jgi:hypothetical protein
MAQVCRRSAGSSRNESLYKQLTVYEDGKDAECTVGADLPADPLQMDLGLRFGVVLEITIRNTISDARR